ncbi:hypothetical protein PITC_070510 [Penicillium italicum]|uniref:Uncharacterized protein n=1 Tax=Penicillium italicum TaxID=40296 RepID=A0A0A2KNG4_PENIT|nr:hypothetical protein PITC_070510 [Penicillium italicum]
MKVLHSLGFLFVASTVALSIPVTDIPSDTHLVPRELVGYGNNEVEIRTPNEANVLEARASRSAGELAESSHDMVPAVRSIHMTTGLTKKICEDEGAPKCARIVGYVQSGLDIVFLVVGMSHGAVGTSPSAQNSHFDPGPVRRDLPTDIFSADALHAALQNDGLNLEKRDSDPRMTHRFIARNVTLDDQGSASDIAFNYFDNGDFNLHFAGDSGTLPAGNAQDSPIHKRFNGAGFKISATTRNKSKLPRDQRRAMANDIAKSWASEANSSPMSDYMGLVKTGHTPNFYFRIIPETQGFGLNYESVNLCGSMEGFL